MHKTSQKTVINYIPALQPPLNVNLSLLLLQVPFCSCFCLMQDTLEGTIQTMHGQGSKSCVANVQTVKIPSIS